MSKLFFGKIQSQHLMEKPHSKHSLCPINRHFQTKLCTPQMKTITIQLHICQQSSTSGKKWFATAKPYANYLTEAFCRDELQDDWFHCRHIAKSYLRNVQCTNHMSPGTIVSFLESTILAGA